MAILYHPDGRTEDIPALSQRGLTLDDFHRLIGPELDFVYLNRGRHVLVIDDRGILKNLPINRAATVLYRADGGVTPIHGPALYCSLSAPGEDNERWS